MSGKPQATRIQIDALVASVTGGRASVVKTFEGPDQLIGIVIQSDNEPNAVLWVTSSGHYLVAGNIYDASQRNLTTIAGIKFAGLSSGARPGSASGSTSGPVGSPGVGNQTARSAPRALAPMSREQFFDATVAAPSLVQGSGGRHLYVYFDPDCGHCKLLYRALQPSLLSRGGNPADKLTIHWIPVGITNNASRAAGTLLAGPDAIDAIIRNGAIAPSNDPAALEAIANNTRLLASSGRAATPTLVYRDSGGRVSVISGRPQGARLQAVLAGIERTQVQAPVAQASTNSTVVSSPLSSPVPPATAETTSDTPPGVKSTGVDG